jgi:c-di-AMP phosphodiesterase-like protein
MSSRNVWADVFHKAHAVHLLSIGLLGGAGALWWVKQSIVYGVVLVAASVVVGIAYVLHVRAMRTMREAIQSISHRVKRLSHEVISELPIGIVLYDDERRIEWHNPWIATVMHRPTLVGATLQDICKTTKWNKLRDEAIVIECAPHPERAVRVLHHVEDRLVYFFDVTDFSLLSKKYESDRLAIGLLAIDNIDEVMQGMDEQQKSMMAAQVTTKITGYAQKHRLYARRIASDKYVFLLRWSQLHTLQERKFDVLDDVRQATAQLKIPMTVSIGIAAGQDDLIVLGTAAQAALDLALGRGGDQVAVKVGDRYSFYGGRSGAVEKRSKIRARVFAHAMRDMIKESDHVLIMGHKLPDMDCVGSAIGVLRMTDVLDVPASIVMEGTNSAIAQLIDVLEEHETIRGRVVTPSEALEMITQRTLVVVVDTHKASLLAEPKCMAVAKRKILIDHHRRSEDGIEDATLVYMEPYASSASELVTELLPYVSEAFEVGRIEATALLAGIVMDTNRFSVRTGARTYEAAAYLRRSGADSALVQCMMKDNMTDYLIKADIVRTTKLIDDEFAVAIAPKGQKASALLCAQVADTLLAMQGVRASFVLWERSDGRVHVSARSLGEVNVQMLMEAFGGGGHLTHAAAQVDRPMEEVVARLYVVIGQLDAMELGREQK